MVKINIDDFNFVYNLLEKQDKLKLKKHSKADGDSAFIEDDMADDFASAILGHLGTGAKQRHMKQATAGSGRQCRNFRGCELHRLSVVVVTAYRQSPPKLKPVAQNFLQLSCWGPVP